MYPILADAAAGGDTLLTGLVGALGGAGFSVWYGWYVTTKAIPRIVAQHTEERKADREERLKIHETLGEKLTALTSAISGLPCHHGIPVCHPPKSQN